MQRICAGLFSLIVLFVMLGNNAAAKRVALVIGNDAYANLPAGQQLQKAKADADAISMTLSEIGFKVLNGRDLTRSQLNLKIADLANLVEPGDTVAFFFAGHGIRLDGRNFLLASDIPQINEARRDFLKSEAIPVDRILAQFRQRGARVSLLILDACRNDPFVDNTGRSVLGTRGLTRIDPPEGAFVLFSAGAGQTALDRLPGNDPHPNSVFTRKLIPLLKQPGVEIGRMARLVRRQVRELAKAHGHTQLPATYNELIGDFYLNGQKAESPNSKPAPQAGNVQRDFDFARSIGTKEAWEAFLGIHGHKADNPYVQLARAALKKLAVGAFPKPDNESAAPKVEKCMGIETTVAGKKVCLQHKQSFRDRPTCPEMVVIPPGKFIVGSPEGEYGSDDDERPRREVTISKAFAVGKFEVTRDQFSTFAGDTNYRLSDKCKTHGAHGWIKRQDHSYLNPGFKQSGSHPVVCVSWKDARAYVSWLSRKTGRSYRLLTEAEWEYAARAGSSGRFSFKGFFSGEEEESDLCKYSNGADRSSIFLRWRNNKCSDGVGDGTAPVGRYMANSFGLHDVHGNVWEWVRDCYRNSYEFAPKDGTAVTSGVCDSHVRRGGSWSETPRNLRSAERDGHTSDDQRDSDTGFRVSRTLTP